MVAFVDDTTKILTATVCRSASLYLRRASSVSTCQKFRQVGDSICH